MKVFDKDPDSVLDYGFDWSDWLGSDTISSSDWILSSNNLTEDSSSNDSTTTTIWISGGVAGEKCLVTNRIVTNGSRTVDRSFVLEVNER